MILVTGGTGNIGRHVVDQLRRKDVPVRAMGRALADFTKPDTWPAALEGVRQVYLFPWAPPEFVHAAVAAGARRFVVHSAAAAGFSLGAPRSAFERHLVEERDAHRSVEVAVEESGAEWTHVRPGLLAVNALAWAPRIRAERVVREPYPTAGYPVVHEADVAEVAVAALLTDAHVGAAYTITGPAKVSQLEQARAIGAALGEEVRFEELTLAQARVQRLADGWPPEYLDWSLEMLADTVHGTGVVPPTDTFERLTGRPPRPFTQWARDHAPTFR